METFAKRLIKLRESNHLTQKNMAAKLGISSSFLSDVENGRSVFSYDVLASLHREFGVSIDWLILGIDSAQGKSETVYRDVRGDIVPADRVPEFALVPVHSQKVSAGMGQEALDDMIISWLPVPLRMFRGEPHANARASEVRGDSMTGINMMDGDYVIYNVGSIRSNGLYVLRVADELFVKRVAFDKFHKKLIITSENPRYPEHVELVEDDLDNVTIIGKVYGWTHVHPY